MQDHKDKPTLTTLTIGRRQFLFLAGGSLLASGPLGLIGCGGGGGRGGGGAGTGQIGGVSLKGKIVWPNGTSYPGVTVRGFSANAKVDSSGGFQFVGFAGAPILAAAVSSSGQILLLGLLSPTATTLGAASTALALAGFALNLGAHVPDIQQAYLSALNAPGTLDALTSAVSASMKSNGANWMAAANAGLTSALQAVITTFGTSTAPALKTASPDGVVVDPTARTSGLQANADGVGHVEVVNYYRRKIALYVDRVSYQTEEGDVVPSAQSNATYPILIPAIEGTTDGALVAIGSFLGGAEYYEPTESGEIAVPVAPEDKEPFLTNYTLTAVGLGIPAGDYAQLTEVQQEGFVDVALETLIFDLVVPAITFGFLPIAKETINEFHSFLVATPVYQDILRAAKANNEVMTAIKAGNVAAAGQAVDSLLNDSETLISGLILVVAQYAKVNLSNFTIEEVEQQEFGTLATEAVEKVLGVLNVATQGLDSIIAVSDFVRSQRATIFTLQETGATVKLNPTAAFLSPEDPKATTFTLSLTDASINESTALAYRWSCQCLYGDISDGNPANSGKTTFDSTSKILNYSANGHGTAGDTDTISCEAFEIVGNKREPLGTAAASATMVAVVTPNPATVNDGSEQVFTVSPLSANVPTTGLNYEWSLPDSHVGTLSVGTSIKLTTTVPSVTFFAGTKAGSTTLSVRILDANGNVVTQGSASITVETLAVSIAPANSSLRVDQKQTYTVVAKAGNLPNDARYKWTLSGKGSIGSSDTVTTTAPSVVYTSPADASSDTLSVVVTTSAGSVLADGETTITVGAAITGTLEYQFTNVPSYLSANPTKSGTLTNVVVSGFGPILEADFADATDPYFHIDIQFSSSNVNGGVTENANNSNFVIFWDGSIDYGSTGKISITNVVAGYVTFSVDVVTTDAVTVKASGGFQT